MLNLCNTENLNNDELRALIESDLKKDLHMHTTYSDGELTPEELIDFRMSQGYELLAITDHDVIGGSVAGANYAKKVGIPFIYGIEFDSEDEVGKDLHMLGYGFDPENEIFLDCVIDVLTERNKRNRQFMEALNKRGYGITDEDVKKVNSGRYVGKPTYAAILVKKGIVSSVNEAFATLFKEPDLKAIKKVTMPSKQAIDAIHAAGGLAVMAHPMEQRKRDESFADFRPRMFDIIDTMIAYGIDGLECYHPSANEEQSKMLRDYAEQKKLMITRGSDFHTKAPRDYSRFHKP